MLSEILYEDDHVKWVVFARDPKRPDYVVDTNEYLLIADGKGMLLDPGGLEIFPEVVSAVSDHIKMDDVTILFGSHQDPDIISSLPLWLGACPRAKAYVPWTWTSFISHFGCEPGQLIAVPDEGLSLALSDRHSVELIPAHYLHASGNLHVYDARAKILFSGDVGAALLPADEQALFVENFTGHTRYMEGFHRRWMPSEAARDAWLEQVRRLDIGLMCPQHGSIFKGGAVTEFLDWFAALTLGAAIGSNRGVATAA
jgi:flavorubredoxin